MAGLEPLIPLIYHEKQEVGSMLCAQHALNSLLQGAYFTTTDLSAIAQRLDHLEASYDDANQGTTSTNMDDTGFFSVQVLEHALEVWGLGLKRWRSEEMRPYQDRPHTQLAFILNLEQHWFTLRRFGNVDTDPAVDPSNGHWFNLNSFLAAPEWVSKLYLGMVLQQAEADGYSVFAVTQIDRDAPLALARTEADDVASTLPEPRSAARPSHEAFTSRQSGTTPQAPSIPPLDLGDNVFEDEDLELQAALHASLSGQGAEYESLPAPSSGYDPSYLPPSSGPSSGRPLSPLGITPRGFEDDPDPVATSMARNKAMLDEMLRHQQLAQQEVLEGDDAEAAERRARRRQEEEEEQEMLRRAIAESEAMARQQQSSRRDDEQMDVDEDPSNYRTPPENFSRVYDDDDAELQAALRASLEHASQVQTHTPTAQDKQPSKDAEEEAEYEEEDSVTANESSTQREPDMEEMRRRRLERFGHSAS